MKKPVFDYEMKLTFSSPVTDHRFQLRCVPATGPRQQVVDVEVAIEPAEVVLVSPGSYEELAQCCYEVGNRHAPLYYFTDPTRPDGMPKLAVLRDGAMDDLFAKLGVLHETCFLKLDEGARLKLVTGAHHHHHHD